MFTRKLLIVTTSFPNSEDSSSGIFVKRLTNALAVKMPGRVQVVAPGFHDSGDLESPYDILRVQYASKTSLRKMHGKGGLPEALGADKKLVFLLPVLVAALFKAVYRSADRSSVLLANWTLSGAVCVAVGALKRCSVVTVLRGSDVNKANNSFLARTILFITLCFSEKLVCVSPALRQAVIAIFPSFESKVIVIENGVETRLPMRAKAAVIGPITISIVGNATPNKNFSVILDALSTVDPKGEKFNLNIIGDGSELPALKARATNLGLSSIKFLGSVHPEAVLEALDQSVVFINSSFSEGRSNALLEALQSGCLPVVSSIPGNLSVVQHGVNGLVFDPGDSDSLSEQLIWIINNRESAYALAEKGRTEFLQRSYSWSTCAEKYQKVFNHLKG